MYDPKKLILAEHSTIEELEEAQYTLIDIETCKNGVLKVHYYYQQFSGKQAVVVQHKEVIIVIYSASSSEENEELMKYCKTLPAGHNA